MSTETKLREALASVLSTTWSGDDMRVAAIGMSGKPVAPDLMDVTDRHNANIIAARAALAIPPSVERVEYRVTAEYRHKGYPEHWYPRGDGLIYSDINYAIGELAYMNSRPDLYGNAVAECRIGPSPWVALEPQQPTDAAIRCSGCKEPAGAQHRPSCSRQGLVTAASDYRDKEPK